MNGKVCIVTGANSGIGKETARALLRQGATVVMMCRNLAKAEAAKAEIDPDGGASIIELDLQSYDSVRAAAAAFEQRHERLDVLVNNAGLFVPRHRLTADGHEATIQTNHLGPFLLTHLLRAALERSAPARVVTVSSVGHMMGRIHFDDLHGQRRRYVASRVYGDSKLANILFTVELSRRLEGTGVTANCLHPGAVGSNFAQAESSWLSGLMKVGKHFILSSEKGARTSIYLATSPEVADVSGDYFVRRKPARPSRAARDPDSARRLWDLSARELGVGA